MGLKRFLSIGLAAPLSVTFALMIAISGQAADPTRYVSTAGNDTFNTTCSSSMPCRTVQHAVDVALSGDTIRIASGTYVEQVMVTKSLSFIGAGIDTTTIKAPDVKTPDAFLQTYIFELSGAIVDNVTKLTVAGPAAPILNCGPNPASLDMGVVVAHQATLNIKQAAVREIHETPSNGCQRGTAISVGRPGGFLATSCVATDCVGHARIEAVQVTHYQKNGVAARGANSTLDAFGNFIADDPSPIIASNGIEVLTGARGNIQFNSISGNECNLPVVCGSDPLVNDQASGVLVSQGDLGTVVKNNLVATNDIGIYTDDGILIANNNASGNRYESIEVDTDATGAIVRGNTTNADTAHPGNYGIYVNNASGNTFEFNSAHRNSKFDMYTTSVANTFHSNSCDTAFPSRQVWDCTSPPCEEGDGQGDFQGDNGNGNFQFDGDGCRDGDEDNVSSQNRGDGKNFSSTRIDSIQVDSLTNTMTITGIGTSDGAPVAFTLVAVETTLLTPGSVSFVFSDGYSNAGTLLDGSVLLH